MDRISPSVKLPALVVEVAALAALFVSDVLAAAAEALADVALLEAEVALLEAELALLEAELAEVEADAALAALFVSAVSAPV